MDNRLLQNLENQQYDYIAPFLWLHGEDDKLIVSEIQKIYDSGIRSVCLESRTHEDFCRKEWWDDIKLIFDECRRLGMKVWILDDKHFPSGYANGIFKEKYKDLRPFGITEFHVDVAGPCTDACVMADCWLEEPEDEIIGVLACRHVPESDKYTEVLDITDGLSDGLVYFTLPEGMWRIVFLIKTRSGIHETKLDFCDNLNPDTIDLYIDEVYKPHYEYFSEYFGNTFLGFFSDEPGFRNNTKNKTATPIGELFAHYPWHERILKKLEEKYGAKAKSYLAGLWFDIDDISAEIRLDYMNIITDEYSNNFCNKLADWCHEHGIMYIGHIIEDNNAHCMTGSTGGHYFKALDRQDMSGIDVVLHQIVPGLTECANAGFVSYKHMENKFFHYYLAKLASSFAHIDERKKGRAMCEIFGAYGWAEGTKIMKYLTDHMLVRGINYFVPHAFSPKPDDTDCPPNFYDSGKNPQYKYFKFIMGYMNRMCHLLSGGTHVPTCGILYDAEARWMSDEFLPLENVGKVLYDNLLDYDIIPESYLEKMDKDGFINGEKYPLLIVPYAKNIPNYITDKLKRLDIPVIMVSEQNKHVPFEQVMLEQLPTFVEEKSFRDINSEKENKFLRYYHYRQENRDIYMFFNEDINNTVETKVELLGFGGGEYTCYDAFENKAYKCFSDDGKIEINLPPYNSTVIILGKTGVECKLPKARIIEEKELSPEFEIFLREEQEKEYKYYITADKLFNITGKGKLSDFSGNMKYRCHFKTDWDKVILDLGTVGETAEVYINGKEAGVRIIPPYSFNISEFIQPGENELEIIVTNTNVFKKRDRFSKYLLMESSGLLGPIKIKRTEEWR